MKYIAAAILALFLSGPVQAACWSVGDVYSEVLNEMRADANQFDMQVFTSKPEQVEAVGVVTGLDEVVRKRIKAFYIIWQKSTGYWMMIPADKDGCTVTLDGGDGMIDKFAQLRGQGAGKLTEIFMAAEMYIAQQRKKNI